MSEYFEIYFSPIGGSDYRGDSGPLHVSRGTMANPLHKAFIEAGQQAGYPYTEDSNGFQQEGVGPFDRTIHQGKRWSAAQAYLHPVLKRPNLTTQDRAMTLRVLFEGDKAVGVEYEHKGEIKQVKATKEVILSGGAINSPQLLMLSGVGDEKHLKEHGIPLVHHLPGVGQNLQDHLEVYVQQVSKISDNMIIRNKITNFNYFRTNKIRENLNFKSTSAIGF